VPGLKLGDLTESAAENVPLSPVAGKHIGSNGFDDVSSVAVLPAASRRTTAENKVSRNQSINQSNYSVKTLLSSTLYREHIRVA